MSDQISIQPKIKPEYAREWGRLPPGKRKQLEESLKQSGQLYPITVDQYGNIVDSHNRNEILTELSIKPYFQVKQFEDELSALDFVISTNLFVKESSPYVKIMKAEKLKHIFEEKARRNEKLKLPNKGQKGFQSISALNFAPIGRVSKEIGKIANLSYRTVEKAEKIQKLGSSKQIEDLVNDKKSIHEVYCEIDSEQAKKRLLLEASRINSQLALPSDRVTLHYGDILDPNLQAKIPDEVVDLAITDPPYHKQCLPLYEVLPAIIYKKLKPGASFFSLYGDRVKNRYEDCLKAQGLIRMPVEIPIELESGFDHDIDLGITRKKKDFLWYYKPDKEGKRFKTGDLLQNLIKSKRPEKKIDKWEQSTIEAAEIISRTTLPKVGAVVFDPLMGTGAYLAAALKLGRRVIGVDINEEKYNIAKANLLLQLKSESESNQSKT
ncbi:MAG TPA: DNA methyltransferase [Nitrososphaeraceae archaeon]|jgi:predicted methyltransferase